MTVADDTRAEEPRAESWVFEADVADRGGPRARRRNGQAAGRVRQLATLRAASPKLFKCAMTPDKRARLV
jgi:hypothetical protein